MKRCETRSGGLDVLFWKQPAHRDETKSDDASKKRAVDRAAKEQPQATEGADRHEVLAIAGFQPAHCVERVRDEESDD